MNSQIKNFFAAFLLFSIISIFAMEENHDGNSINSRISDKKEIQNKPEHRNICKSLRFIALEQIAQFLDKNQLNQNNIFPVINAMSPDICTALKILLATKKGVYNKQNMLFNNEGVENSSLLKKFKKQISLRRISHNRIPNPKEIADILVTAAFYSNIGLLRFFLIEGSADPNLFGSIYSIQSYRWQNFKLTPLMAACLAKNKQVVLDLLEAGADINSQDDHNFSSIHYAIIETAPEQLYGVFAGLNTIFSVRNLNAHIYPIPKIIYQLLLEKKNDIKSDLSNVLENLLKYKEVQDKDLIFSISMFNVCAVKTMLDSLINSESIDLNKISAYCNELKNGLNEVAQDSYLFSFSKTLKKDLFKIVTSLGEIQNLLTTKLNTIKLTKQKPDLQD